MKTFLLRSAFEIKLIYSKLSDFYGVMLLVDGSWDEFKVCKIRFFLLVVDILGAC